MNCMFCIIFRGSIYNLNFMFPKIMQNITKHLFILSILSLGYISASAQNITLNSYSVKDGLSNSTVKAICQDDKGYIWIGTKNGLNRLDGYEIKNYYHLPGKEVKQPNDIVSITQLSDGLFWIGTFNGIVLFDPMQEKFIDLQERYAGKEFPSSVVVGLHEDPKKNIWVATKQGLYVFKSDGTCSYVKDMRDTYIHMMAAASPYALLLDVVNQGLALYDVRTERYKILHKNEKRFSLMKGFTDSKGRIWLGEELKNFYQYFPKEEEIKPISYTVHPDVPIESNYIHDITEYNDSTLLLATDRGLVAYDIKHSFFYTKVDQHLAISDRLMTVYKDNQGALWIGTFGQGAIYYHPKLFTFTHHSLISSPQQATGIQVVGSLSESQGKLWIGHSKGLIAMDVNNPKHIEEVNISGGNSPKHDTDLYYVYRNSPDELYLYFLNMGVYSLNLKTRSITKVIAPMSGEEQIRAMARDAENRLWIAEDDLSYWDKNTQKLDRNLSTNYNATTRYMLTQDILRHEDDMIVGVRTNGLWIFRHQPENPEHYFKGERTTFEELNDKNISVLYEDHAKNIWIGTYDNGLYKCNLEKQEIHHYNKDNGLVHNSICAILEDRTSKDIWVSAINGLSQIKPDGIIVNFTRGNGFPLNEVSHKSLLQASNGHIYIGGNNGLAELDPTRLSHDRKTAPLVQISLVESLNSKNAPDHIEINNFNEGNKVDLPYDNSSIRIKYSALDFISPKGYKYAYQLKGLDKEWHYIENNEVIYSNLPAGKYIFSIKACNNEGIWSTVETTIIISVHPAFWATWWAKALYILFIIVFLAVLARYFYEKKTAKYKRQIEQIEKENIEKNYQMRIELFTNFSHELRTPLTLITGPVDDIINDERLPSGLKYPMKQIQKNANRLLLLVNQLMDFRKLEHGAMQLKLSCLNVPVFITEQIDSFSELLNKHELTISYSNNYYGNNLWVDVDLMSKVMFNLLSNAIKHSSRGGKIQLESNMEENSVVLSVKDFGEGISPENQSKVFDPFFQIGNGNKDGMFGSGIGLNLVQYVVKLHFGKIWLESTPGQGTTFFIRLQLGKEHYANSNVIYTDQAITHTLKVEKNSVLSVEPEYHQQIPEDSDNRLRILVVEDDEDMRQYIVSKLSKTYNVQEAPEGKSAINIAREQIPDLIISDIMMPVMDGLELCRVIKNDMALAHIPVVLLTAKSLEEHVKDGYQALADDYILKPFNAQILLAKIESLIKNREKLRDLFCQKLERTEVPVEEITVEDPLMQKLVELITENAQDPELSMEVLYNKLGMSRTQFFRKIKAISDLSPNKLILNIRMKMAVEKFQSGGMTIAEVAYEVGFSDPAYFSKVFKSVFNQTPTEYIKNIGK